MTGCYFLAHTNYPNTADVNYKRHTFYDVLSIDLPEGEKKIQELIIDGEKNSTPMIYRNILFTKWLGGSAGDFSISKIGVFANARENKSNKIIITRTIDKKQETFILIREATIPFTIHEKSLRISLYTSNLPSLLNKEAINQRIEIDNKIFDRIVHSIKIKNDKGEWIKPEIEVSEDKVIDNRTED
jgi:hypothetical protein